ncbi:MAG: transglycosylase SLT domain-containing protein [Burkholderiaceae bacterium]
MSATPSVRTAPRRRRRRASLVERVARGIASLVPRARTRRRVGRALRSTPLAIVVIGAAIAVLALWYAANAVVQVVRKPTELFFPVAGVLTKTPAETWRTYAPLFRAHATAVMTPELLAALAQAEGGGNPVARTYWRWRLTAEPFEVYRPASSAVGMYQITDGTYREAKRYCIRDGVVVEDGPWHDWRACWFNALYLRVLPSHAIEMTAALLDRQVAAIVARHRLDATREQKQDLAALVHLCGAGAGDLHARRGLQIASGQRCGDHDVAAYLAKVDALKRVFARLAERG